MATLIEVPRRTLTVNDYHTAIDGGMPSEEDRVELLDGEIVEVSLINRGAPHAIRRRATTSFNPSAAARRFRHRPDHIDNIGRRNS